MMQVFQRKGSCGVHASIVAHMYARFKCGVEYGVMKAAGLGWEGGSFVIIPAGVGRVRSGLNVLEPGVGRLAARGYPR